MGFKTVYQCLTDVFPQVDSRILKAVAIENAKDADTAVEIVLLEILPFLQKNPTVAAPPSVGTSHTDSSDGGAEQEEETPLLRHQLGSFGKDIEFSVEPRSVVEEDSRKADLTDGVPVVSTNEEEELIPSAPIKVHENLGSEQLCRSIESEELILLANPQNQKIYDQAKSTQALEVFPNALVHGVDADPIQVCANIVTEVPAVFSESDKKFRNEHEERDTSCSLVQENHGSEWDDLSCPVADDLDVINCEKNLQVESLIDGTVPETGDSVVKQTSGAEEAFSPGHIQDIINDCNNLMSKQDNIVDPLEEMIEDAKSNKKALFLAMESVMKMMREVELKEEEAELAKEEAAREGVDILHQMEELKKMLVHAKEANDMRAGEVYGEKAILATELRELQARLLGLSDERDKALAILDKMHQTIRERLSVAEEMRKAAELEKLEKEESARNALAEQEAIVEQVIQESKILQREAEENTKLQEFLMDRGHVVDMLQGEISVICQDVRLLKEKFDDRVPLSKSISSSQTSCILASSGSFLKSTPFELNLEVVEKSKSSKDASPASSVASVDNDDESPKSNLEQERIISCNPHSLDDGWEFFESAEMWS